MMRLGVNLSIVFARIPFVDRFEAASRAGFDLVEMWWPRLEFAAGLTDEDVVRAAHDARVSVKMLNFDGGDLAAGERGLAGDPTRAAEFRANVPHALELADRLGCRKLNALAGLAAADVDQADQLALLTDSIAYAAGASAAAGATVLVEPLNLLDTPGYLVPTVDSALALIATVGQPNVKVQFDVFHVARAGDDPIAAARRAAGHIGHVQIADVPGRHEPGTGELPFGSLFETLRSVGYDGDVGLEYVPTNPEAPNFAYCADLREILAGPALPAAH